MRTETLKYKQKKIIPMRNEKAITQRRSRVVELLAGHPEGLTLEKISDEMNAHRNTIAKDLDVLRWKNPILIVKRFVGTATLYYHKKHAKNIEEKP